MRVSSGIMFHIYRMSFCLPVLLNIHRTDAFFLVATDRKQSNNAVLGRIVVHDRIQVEARVLPRYFNHSSFASLRRQLNYFSFIRLGKGRQRESTYINENVIELDDILNLKRRPTTSGHVNHGDEGALKERFASEFTATVVAECPRSVETAPVPLLDSMAPFADRKTPSLEHRHKRRRSDVGYLTTVLPRNLPSAVNHPISDDDESSGREEFVVLDLTGPEQKADDDFLAGCRNLLFLSSKRWE